MNPTSDTPVGTKVRYVGPGIPALRSGEETTIVDHHRTSDVVFCESKHGDVQIPMGNLEVVQIPTQNPSEFVPGTRVRGRIVGRIGHVVDAPLPKRFDGQQPAVMVLWEGQDSARPMYTFVLQALPPRTYSILTIEIPIHHAPGAKAHSLASGVLDVLLNRPEWTTPRDGDPEWVDGMDLARAIRCATLTEPEVQS